MKKKVFIPKIDREARKKMVREVVFCEAINCKWNKRTVCDRGGVTIGPLGECAGYVVKGGNPVTMECRDYPGCKYEVHMCGHTESCEFQKPKTLSLLPRKAKVTRDEECPICGGTGEITTDELNDLAEHEMQEDYAELLEKATKRIVYLEEQLAAKQKAKQNVQTATEQGGSYKKKKIDSPDTEKKV